MDLPAFLKGLNPAGVTGTAMPPSLLLLCKILAATLLATGHYRILPDPFLPFLPFLDLADPALFRTTLQVVCVGSALALLCNRWVRASALVCGSCLLLAVVSSKAYYGNNKTFVGLSLVLAGLSDFDRPPWLLRCQLALVYFGAALNKLLDPDWQSGQFFDYWAGEKLKNPIFLIVSESMVPLLAGKIMCWGTIVAEFAVAFGLLTPRLIVPALWGNILFQVGLLEFTGNTFTMFFYSMSAATLAFITWPPRLEIFYDDTRKHRRWLQSILTQFDPNGLQTWRPLEPGAQTQGLHLLVWGKVHSGLAAFRLLLAYCPAFWLTATVLLTLAPDALTRRLLVAVVLAFFLPMIYHRGKS